MSAYVFENGSFAPFYGISILSPIKNKKDFEPLFLYLKKYKEVVLVDNINLKIFDIFSQTLASFVEDSCKSIEYWFKNNGGVLKPYQYLDYDVILKQHYEAKEILKTQFPQDFEISKNTEIKIKNNKIILHFNFYKNSHKEAIKSINNKLNKIYGTKRTFSRSIIIGYIKQLPFSLNEETIKILNSLIPKKIYIDYPDVYQYKNLNEYVIYSHGMF